MTKRLLQHIFSSSLL